MGSFNKSLLLFLTLALSISSLLVADTIPVGLAQNGTNVNSGIINSDTTWTKANSPYNLTGPVAINQGVTLTIEPGTIVNLNYFYIQVNGTLMAQGSLSDPIIFNGDRTGDAVLSYVNFSQSSNNWNEQKETGNIIENCHINEISINVNNASPKINNNQITSKEVSYKEGGGIFVNGGDPIISNNNIKANGAVSISNGSPLVQKNTISGFMGIIVSAGSPIIANNVMTGIEFTGWTTAISFPDGSTGDSYISDNTISNYDFAIQVVHCSNIITIQRNLINNSTIDTSQSQVIIQNNTLTNALIYVHAGPIITYNNFQNNVKISLTSSSNVIATYNWWGTTNQQVINETIHDYKNDFNLGTVNFVPFLTAPNPQAIPNITASIPTPNVSSSPISTTTPATTLTPTVPEFPSWTTLLLAALMLTGAGLLVYFNKHKP